MDALGELVNLELVPVELRPLLQQGIMSNRIELDLPPPLPDVPPPPLPLYTRRGRRIIEDTPTYAIEDSPTHVMTKEEHSSALWATREGVWESGANRI